MFGDASQGRASENGNCRSRDGSMKSCSWSLVSGFEVVFGEQKWSVLLDVATTRLPGSLTNELRTSLHLH